MSAFKLCLLSLGVLAAASPAIAQDGLTVSAAGFGAQITTTGSDAIRIVRSSDDGIQIGAAPDYPSYGLYIPSPGVSTYGLWPNTANAQGEWALFTVDKISAGNVTVASQSLIAHVGEGAPVSPGDTVAAVGVGAMAEDATVPAVSVQRAGISGAGIVGVVQSRLRWVEPSGKEGERALESVEGPARPGDYVSVIVAGVALARIETGAMIAPGQRLTVGDLDGRIRPLRTRWIDGFPVGEAAPTVGVALEASGGKDAILVFVSAR